MRPVISRRCMLQVAGATVVLAGLQRPVAALPATIRLVAGFPAGGASDSMARLLAEEMQRRLGVTVIVENKAGAGGRLAAEAVKAAPPDGSHVLLANTVMMVLAPLSTPPTRYDPTADFEAVARAADYQLVLATGPRTGARDLAGLMAWWKANPDAANYGVPAAGSLPHLYGIELARGSGLALASVVYRGGAPIAQDLIGGHLAAGLSAAADFAEAHRYGLLRIVAASGTVRHPALADVPTFAEAGMRGFEENGWNGLFVPKATAVGVRERIERAVLESLADAKIKSRLETLGFIVAPAAGAALQAAIPREQQRLAELVRLVGPAKP